MRPKLPHPRGTLGLLALVPLGLLLAACPIPDGYRAGAPLGQLPFAQMLGMQVVPGDEDHVVVLSKDGIARRADLADPSEPATTFLDISDRLIPDPQSEEGLLGLAFAPDYAASGRFYVWYSAGPPRRERLSRFIANGASADPASEEVLLEVDDPYPNHNGGGMAFGPDGMLYIGEGDGGSAGDPQGNAQRLDTLLGKVLRVDVSPARGYAIPADNPFAGVAGARPEIWAYGFRNPWRLSFDSATGELWVGDVGQNRWEEIDRVVRGGNYGWSVAEGAHCYKPASGCDFSGTILPWAEYGHDAGCSITGGYVYRGGNLPELRGWYVYGDFCSGRIWAVNTDGDRGTPVPLADTGLAIASFGLDRAGELYIVDFGGSVRRLERK